MKKILIIILFIIGLINCNRPINERDKSINGKVKILDSLNIEKDTFTLFLIHSLEGSRYLDTGHYYINNPNLLKQLQQEWILESETNHIFRLYPDYQLFFMKKGTVAYHLQVASNKNLILLPNLFKFKFQFNKLSSLFLKRNEMFFKKYQFYSIKEWNIFKTKIDSNKIFINNIIVKGNFLSNSNALKYPFFFRFKYEVNFNKKDSSRAKIAFSNNIIDLKKIIYESYNDSLFYMSSSYSNLYSANGKVIFDVDIFCQKKLYKQFNLFPRLDNFEEYPIKLTFFSKDSIIFKE